MSVKKNIIIFIISFLVSLYFFSVYSDTKELEIVELGDGIHAHKYVQDYIKDHNLRTDDVIKAYKAAMSKREAGNSEIIFEKSEDFVIFIEPEEKMIVSIGPNGPVKMKEEL